MVLLEQINIMPLVALHSRSVQVNVPKVPKFISQRLHFLKSKHYIHFYLLCHFRRLFLIVIGKKKQLLQILHSCSQKWPYSKADDMASSKIKCNVGSFYNKVDKLSCHERCNIVHNV